MDNETRERFAEIDGYIAEVETRLVVMSRQNAAMSEVVEVLGRYVNTALDAVERHVAEDH